jgi:hypothetical protein
MGKFNILIDMLQYSWIGPIMGHFYHDQLNFPGIDWSPHGELKINWKIRDKGYCCHFEPFFGEKSLKS